MVSMILIKVDIQIKTQKAKGKSQNYNSKLKIIILNPAYYNDKPLLYFWQEKTHSHF
jgi:hypothetical protein